MKKKDTEIKYAFKDFDPAKLDPLNIDRLAVERVPERSFVLDIGCAAGSIGNYLIKEKRCEVYGVEIRESEAEIAKESLSKIILVDIEQDESIKKILQVTKNKKFDVILATSLIEHLKNPDSFLRNCKKLLKPQGIVMVTTPNIAHWTMRVSLLKGNFDYTEYGILDNTHLHLFTIKSFYDMFEKNGYKITDFAIDSVGGGYPRISMILAKWFPAIFGYQMLIVAK